MVRREKYYLQVETSFVGLDSLTETQERQLRRILYGLYALVQLHFNKEEEIYLPLLDAQLSPEEGQALFASMGAVAADVKRG